MYVHVYLHTHTHTHTHVYTQQLEHVRFGSKAVVLPRHANNENIYTYEHTPTNIGIYVCIKTQPRSAHSRIAVWVAVSLYIYVPIFICIKTQPRSAHTRIYVPIFICIKTQPPTQRFESVHYGNKGVVLPQRVHNTYAYTNTQTQDICIHLYTNTRRRVCIYTRTATRACALRQQELCARSTYK